MNCIANYLNSDTNYEIRICTIYNNIHSIWSETKKIKTSIIDSTILNESKRCDEFMNKIYEWTGGKSMELLFRGTRDGMSGKEFHNRCNNKGPTICLFKNENGYIFGGYAAIDWNNDDGVSRSAPDSFIFTLTNMYNISPTKFPNSDNKKCIWNYPSYGPVFGNDGFDIEINFHSSHFTNFPHAYKDVLGKGYSIFKGDNNNYNFILKEIEVFKLIK